MITILTTNIILILMAIVWAWLSIKNNELQEVSRNFILLGVILSGPEVVKSLIIIKDLLFPAIQAVVN